MEEVAGFWVYQGMCAAWQDPNKLEPWITYALLRRTMPPVGYHRQPTKGRNIEPEPSKSLGLPLVALCSWGTVTAMDALGCGSESPLPRLPLAATTGVPVRANAGTNGT